MKVECLNSSSIKTRNKIKQAFVELIKEKKQLNKITIKELAQKADITRSTFYTHYDNLYQVVEEYKLQTIELLCNEDLILTSKQDILNYFDNIFECLKKNNDTYKQLLTADDSLLFLFKLKDIASIKIYNALKNNNIEYLDLTISFLMNGILMEIIKYYRNESNYNLEDLLINIKKWFNKLLN